ncbi:tetratricopeptide repeat protein [Okeania sp.]|uniref:tetratricopeptide repeat protein n=1 Tax=Okeania sp. TaxID=3100323 RepID=UPI002B4AEB66|nr:tetratricopeptide repeat protein [Okeania sp.]MEB3340130.1 tetratricopeptide repeat protein [Okeania sp.]
MGVTAFARGNQLFQEGKLGEAIACYQKSIQANPQFTCSYENLAKVLEQVGRIDEAIAALRQAVAINPQNPLLLNYLGRMLSKQGQLTEAVDYFRRALEIRKDVCNFYLDLASALLKLGKWSEVEDCLDQMIQFSLDSQSPHPNPVGTLHPNPVGTLHPNPVGTLHATSLPPTSYSLPPTPYLPDIYYYWAEAKSGQQQWSEAVEFYQQSWDIDSSRVDCGVGLAKALGKLGRWSEAVDTYHSVVVLSIVSGEVFFGLGQALGQLGRWSEAVGEYKKAIDLGFEKAEVRHDLGYAHTQLGRWEEAVVEYRLVLEVNPKSAVVRYQLGYALMRLGYWSEAEIELRKSVELYPKSAVVWQQLGDVLKELGKKEEAVEVYGKAIALNPDTHNKEWPRVSISSKNNSRVVTVNVLQFTPEKTRNPFYTIIPTEVMKHSDINFRFTTNRDDVIKSCLAMPKPTVIHFHQLDPLYHPGDKAESSIRQRAKSLLDFLGNIKKEGGKIVWTKHNPLPHDRQFASVDIELQQKVLDIVDRVIVLGYGAKKILSSVCPPDKITVIPHPAFDLVYGDLLPKTGARRRLGLETDGFLFGSIGEIKPYKGLEFQIETFAKLTDEKPTPKLIIAGNPGSQTYVDKLKANLPNNVLLQPGKIPFDEMSAWISSLDASIFSFQDIWVSSSVILSISYQTPVIVPDIGLLREYVEQDNTGFLYKHRERDSLLDAIKSVMLSPYPDHYKYMCRVFCEKHAVTTIADRYINLYKKVSNL